MSKFHGRSAAYQLLAITHTRHLVGNSRYRMLPPPLFLQVDQWLEKISNIVDNFDEKSGFIIIKMIDFESYRLLFKEFILIQCNLWFYAGLILINIKRKIIYVKRWFFPLSFREDEFIIVFNRTSFVFIRNLQVLYFFYNLCCYIRLKYIWNMILFLITNLFIYYKFYEKDWKIML